MTVPVAAKVGIIAASVAVAAAIAIYESPEVRRMADDFRRRIALALHQLGENVDPNREPRFNRPEDADGFYESHDVDADEETRRRQREEIMYWNARREENQQKERQETQQRSRGSSFDDFLQPDRAAEHGTFVYNSGSNAWNSDNVLRHRGNNTEGARGLDAAILTNPFSDEYGIELDDQPRLLQDDPLAVSRDEIMSDIYNATPRVLSPHLGRSQTLPQHPPMASEVLFDFESHAHPEARSLYASAIEAETAHQPQPEEGATTPMPTTTTRSVTLERELADDEYMTAGQEEDAEEAHTSEAYASIQAWAHNSSNPGFYSPLPESPAAPLSEPELISEGQLTPTDSMSVIGSVAGSGVDVAHHDADAVSEYDVMSESEGGVATPNSWSEVGSVVSEDESERGRVVHA